jgi:magnesium-protoporphyrin IX monomethyl ester (oxidative) cyclase
MKVLLIYPRLKITPGVTLGAPLGILYIAAVLRLEGHQVEFLDLTLQDEIPPLEPLLKDIGAVGVSFSSVLASQAFEVVRKIKAVDPSIPCIAGGPHPTALPGHTLRSGFDIVVVGEGEKTIAELIKALEEKRDIDDVAGLALLKEGETLLTEKRAFIDGLDRIPMPARDLIDWPGYYARSAYDGVIASRGCPYSCRFCKPMQDNLFGRKIRYRSPVNILREIAECRDIYHHHSPMVKMGVGFFAMFLDDMFVSKPDWVLEFCTEVEKAGMDFWWGCQSRVDTLHEKELIRMKETGCKLVVFGVESGSQQVLDFYGKGITIEDTRRVFSLCQKHGMLTHAYMIIGSPEETREDLDATYNLLKEIRPTTSYIARATPHPGSYLYEYAMERGIMGIDAFDERCDYYFNKKPMLLTHLTEVDLDEFEQKVSELFPNQVDLRVAKK